MKSIDKPKGSRKPVLARTRDLFSGFWGNAPGAVGRKVRPTAGANPLTGEWPSLDVSESDREIRVRLEIPGLSEKDLDVTYRDGALVIKGGKQEQREGNSRGVRFRESRYGSFTRIVPVGEDVDYPGAKAEYRHGILDIELPKKMRDIGRKRIPIT